VTHKHKSFKIRRIALESTEKAIKRWPQPDHAARLRQRLQGLDEVLVLNEMKVALMFSR
jgi:hypothetical protein